MTADEILRMLRLPIADVAAARRTLQGSAVTTSALVEALARADTSELRAFLCETIGKRCRGEAPPALLACLEDPAPNTRYVAADALASTHEPSAGPALLRRFLLESDPSVRGIIAGALGAVGYRKAIPALRDALASEHESIRHYAGWSLDQLNAADK